jgi:dsRNA-specific ribonuclease
MDTQHTDKINSLLSRFFCGLHIKTPEIYGDMLKVGSPIWERMEFLGDAVINLAAADGGYHKHPHFHEGELSRYRTQLVRGTTLAEMFRFCEMNTLVHPDILRMNNDKLLEDMFETFVAAIYLDNDFAIAKEWFCSMADEYIRNQGVADKSVRKVKEQYRKRAIKIAHSYRDRIWYSSIDIDGVTRAVGTGDTKDASVNAAWIDIATWNDN